MFSVAQAGQAAGGPGPAADLPDPGPTEHSSRKSARLRGEPPSAALGAPPASPPQAPSASSSGPDAPPAEPPVMHHLPPAVQGIPAPLHPDVAAPVGHSPPRPVARKSAAGKSSPSSR